MNKTIRSIHARRVWDSRGRPTVEAEVTLDDGAIGRAIVPAGASKGTREALELRDGSARFGGLDVLRAVGNVNDDIARALVGTAADDQAALDARLIALDGTASKTRLGANATLAVSMAAAHATAASRGVPLYESIGGAGAALMPMPQIQIFGGGAHAGRRVDVQDFMIVCPRAANFAEALEWTAEVYRCAGELLQSRGARYGVADEGGWWPAFSTNEEALEALVAAIERAGFVPGERRGHRARHRRVGLRPRRSLPARARRTRTRFGWTDRAAAALDRALSHRFDRRPARRGRSRGLRALHAGRGPPGAGRRRRLPGVARAAGRAGRGPRRGERGPAQAQPARHPDRDAAGVAGGAGGGLRRASCRRARARRKTRPSCTSRSAGRPAS